MIICVCGRTAPKCVLNTADKVEEEDDEENEARRKQKTKENAEIDYTIEATFHCEKNALVSSTQWTVAVRGDPKCKYQMSTEKK